VKYFIWMHGNLGHQVTLHSNKIATEKPSDDLVSTGHVEIHGATAIVTPDTPIGTNRDWQIYKDTMERDKLLIELLLMEGA